MKPLVEIHNLTIEYRHQKSFVAAVRNLDLILEKGKTLGLVGESGSGKSTLALALLGLLPERESRIASGDIQFDGNSLIHQTAPDWLKLRGRRIAMIFQDPFSALNPVLTIEYQLRETNHTNPNELLSQVQLSDTNRILKSYPHQLSGGQRQRVLIAMALAQNPDLLIADEPTTALDVTVQAEIISLLKTLQSQLKMSMLFITHNLGLVKDISDTLAVMYAGQLVELGPTKMVLSAPQHPYTQGLIRCLPSLKRTTAPIPVLEGQPPEPTKRPSGCAFHPRCRDVKDVCATVDPNTRSRQSTQVRCHLYPET